jgi:N-acetyl-gamma-glutamylphosphate reductase
MTLAGVVTPLYPTVKDIGDRLEDSDAESWWRPSDEEMAAVKQWVVGVNEMYKIISNHKASFVAAPGTVPPPSVEIVPPVKEGIPTQNLVIGGIAAVGLAFLISAFA